MLLLKIWNYVRGYVIIIIEGYFLEKFVNICMHRCILLWDIVRRSETSMELKLSIKGFKMLRPVARKTKCRVRIKEKRGLPFVFNRYRKRKAFVAGAALFFILINIMTSFIWSIEITGNENLKTEYLESILKSKGIKTGVLKYGINTKNVVEELMLELRELSWISIEIKGTKLKAQVRERLPAPEIIPLNEPCSIIASKDGLISRIIVKEGMETVRQGDTVKKGQELISGKLPIRNEKDKYRLVHAIGTVEARTWYEGICPVDTEIVEKKRSGRQYGDYSLIVLNKKIDIFNRKKGYQYYEKDELKKILTIGSDMVLPFGLIKNTYYEIILETTEIEYEEAMDRAADKAYEDAMEKVPEDAKVLDTETTFEDNASYGQIARVTVECIEDIGISVKIGGE